MPTGIPIEYCYKPKTWKTMSRYDRKRWYRENEARRFRGQKLLSKP